MPPTPFCPECQSQNINWAEQANEGILYTYTVVDRSPFPGVVENFRYVGAILDLPAAGHVRIMGNVINAAAEDLKIGMKMKVVWSPVNGGWKVPLFQPA